MARDLYLQRVNVLARKPSAGGIVHPGYNTNVIDAVALIREFCDGDIATAGPHVEATPSDHPAGGMILPVPFPMLDPRSLTGAPSSVTSTLMSAEAATFAPEAPALALLVLICI
jgi:hypothetical protein